MCTIEPFRSVGIKGIVKIVFVISGYAWYFASKVALSSTSIPSLVIGLLIFSLGLHWVYAFTFGVNMHNHIGKTRAGESKLTRLFSFMFGLGVVAYVSWPNTI